MGDHSARMGVLGTTGRRCNRGKGGVFRKCPAGEERWWDRGQVLKGEGHRGKLGGPAGGGPRRASRTRQGPWGMPGSGGS